MSYLRTVIIVLALCSMATGARSTPPDSLGLCDRAYLDGDVTASAEVARDILDREPDRAEAAWRLSRALIAESNISLDDDRRPELLEEARRWAEVAVASDPNDTHGYTCLAICAGNLLNMAGGKKKIELAETVRAAAEKAIELEEDNDLAWLVLGVWNREVAGVGGVKKALAGLFYGGVPRGASLERAEQCLRRAVELAPGHVNHHRELGITMVVMKRYDEAVAAFERAVALPPVKPGDAAYQADARERLRKARKMRDELPDHGPAGKDLESPRPIYR